MLYIELNFTLTVSEPIGRFFPNRIALPRDSKMKKGKQSRLDIEMENIIDAKTKSLRFRISRNYVFSCLHLWRISWPFYRILEKRRTVSTRYLHQKCFWYTEMAVVFSVFEKLCFFLFWHGFFKRHLMTSSVWLIDIHLRIVNFSPDSYYPL